MTLEQTYKGVRPDRQNTLLIAGHNETVKGAFNCSQCGSALPTGGGRCAACGSESRIIREYKVPILYELPEKALVDFVGIGSKLNETPGGTQRTQLTAKITNGIIEGIQNLLLGTDTPQSQWLSGFLNNAGVDKIDPNIVNRIDYHGSSRLYIANIIKTCLIYNSKGQIGEISGSKLLALDVLLAGLNTIKSFNDAFVKHGVSRDGLFPSAASPAHPPAQPQLRPEDYANTIYTAHHPAPAAAPPPATNPTATNYSRQQPAQGYGFRDRGALPETVSPSELCTRRFKALSQNLLDPEKAQEYGLINEKRGGAQEQRYQAIKEAFKTFLLHRFSIGQELDQITDMIFLAQDSALLKKYPKMYNAFGKPYNMIEAVKILTEWNPQATNAGINNEYEFFRIMAASICQAMGIWGSGRVDETAFLDKLVQLGLR